MSQTSPGKLTTSAVVVGMFSIALLCAIGYSLFEVWQADRAMAWPTTNGIVVESRHAFGCGRKGTGSYPVVRYRYQVGGIRYESRRILFGAASCYSEKDTIATTQRFPVAAIVKVGFDPQAPAQAVLIAGKVDESTRTGIAVMSLWFLLTAAATGMIVIVVRSSRRPSPGLPAQRALGERR